MSLTTWGVPISTDRRWGGVDGLYGGYVIGLLVDAAVEASSYRLASLSANFVSGVAADDVVVEVDQVHRGRSTELVRLVLLQGGRARVHATAELLHVSEGETGPEGEAGPGTWVRSSDRHRLPDVPGDLGRTPQPFDDLIELRRTEPPALTAEAPSWARLRTGIGDPRLRSPEAVLAALIDAPTPGLFGVEEGPDFVPSIDFTVHFAPRAGWEPTDWVRLDHSTGWVTPHHCSDEVTAWTTDGQLLGAVRQTRSVRYRRPT